MVGVDGRLVYESLVLPDNQVADYNTRFSGITKKDLGERWNSIHNKRFGNIGFSAKVNVVDLQGDFFNWASPENVSRLAPPKNALTGLPHFEKVLSMAAERGEIPNTFSFSKPRGG